MTSDQRVPDNYLDRFRAIESRLGEAASPDTREGLKREIIALYKEVDGTLTELSRLKDELRSLVERYKQVAAGAQADGAQAPQFSGARPAVHSDHIGASTFMEKGWSLISLGDHAGAVQALQRALEPVVLDPGHVPDQAEQAQGGRWHRAGGELLR